LHPLITDKGSTRQCPQNFKIAETLVILELTALLRNCVYGLSVWVWVSVSEVGFVVSFKTLNENEFTPNDT